jgi:hypothetical protein
MLSWLHRIAEVLFRPFSTPREKETIDHIEREKLPPIYFDKLLLVDKTPTNDSLGEKQFIEIVYKNAPRWAMFRCPCSCGAVISLPLQIQHNPRWQVTESPAGRPTLQPSVWQNRGCLSHFWVKDGRVFWCNDSGRAPSIARPDLYPLPNTQSRNPR